MRVIGLDIGGSNLKAADADGDCMSIPFAIWESPDELPNRLRDILRSFPPADCIAVTMTAELADCFTTKTEGVNAILDAVESVAGGVAVVVWQTGAEFVDVATARTVPFLVAAANWHALASWAGRMVPTGEAVLVDVGSTTTDLIPLRDGVPVPRGLTDIERLRSGELLYTGVRRTPVCAIASSLLVEGRPVAPAAELFATSLDVYLLLGKTAENRDDCGTANARPATLAEAHVRLARSVCCDCDELDRATVIDLAQQVAVQQRRQITAQLERVLSDSVPRCAQVVVSGSGSFLADEVLEGCPRAQAAGRHVLASILSNAQAHSAAALAVARLAQERCPLK